MAKIKFKKNTKNILLIILGCVLLFGAIFGIMAMFNQEDKTTKEINPSYAVGGLNSNGAYVETKESIYTKDAFDCNGLKVTPEFTSTIKYQIFFYDFDNNFVSSTNILSSIYNENIDLNVKTARIVIIPNDDAKISWYEINGYAKQLKIEVADKQFDTFENKIASNENLCVLLGQGIYNQETGVFEDNTESPWTFIAPINTKDIDTLIYKVPTSSMTGTCSYVGTTQPKILFYVDGQQANNIEKTILLQDEETTYFSIDVSTYSEVVSTIDNASAGLIKIYGF